MGLILKKWRTKDQKKKYEKKYVLLLLLVLKKETARVAVKSADRSIPTWPPFSPGRA